jgi:hypothetical protein
MRVEDSGLKPGTTTKTAEQAAVTKTESQKHRSDDRPLQHQDGW